MKRKKDKGRYIRAHMIKMGDKVLKSTTQSLRCREPRSWPTATCLFTRLEEFSSLVNKQVGPTEERRGTKN